MSKHTPGPWSLDFDDQDKDHLILGKEGFLIGCVAGWHNKGFSDANARLIAAAPDLFDLAEHIIHLLDEVQEPLSHEQHVIYYKAEQAISKVKGLNDE